MHVLASAHAFAADHNGAAVGATAWPSVHSPVVAPAPDSARGLTALYFNNSTLAGKPTLQRVDAAPNFQWGKDAPAPGINKDYFSVRWEGMLRAPATGSYTFSVRPGEQVRLWIAGQKVLDTWEKEQATHLVDVYISLAANETTNIKLEYHSEEGDAHLQLQWLPPKQARQPIAARYFTPASSVPTDAEEPQVAAAPKKNGAAATSAKATAGKKGAASAPSAVPLSGVYTLKARTNGLPLEVAEEGQYTDSKTTAPPTQWLIEPADEGYYRILVQGGTKVLEVLGSSSSNGAPLNLWPYYHGNNQLWRIQEAGDGYYTLVAKHSQKAITVKDSTSTSLQQWRYTGEANQQWRLEAVAASKAPAKPVPLVGNGMYKVSVYPNPCNGVAQLRYQLSEDIPLGWVLYDSHGVAVQTSDYRRQGAGPHHQTLPLLTLPTGNYQLHLTVGSVTTMQPLLIRHPQGGDPQQQTAQK